MLVGYESQHCILCCIALNKLFVERMKRMSWEEDVEDKERAWLIKQSPGKTRHRKPKGRGRWVGLEQQKASLSFETMGRMWPRWEMKPHSRSGRSLDIFCLMTLILLMKWKQVSQLKRKSPVLEWTEKNCEGTIADGVGESAFITSILRRWQREILLWERKPYDNGRCRD